MTASGYGDMAIFSGRAHPALAERVCAHLEMPLGNCDIFEFANENIFVRILENVRSRDVYLMQSLCSPVNTSSFFWLCTETASVTTPVVRWGVSAATVRLG